jgi:hypothetical protein
MKNYKIFNIFFIAILGLTTFSCGKKGCTDIDASNYDSKAKKNDGSCEYISGCTDPNSLNYNANAQQDDGSCTYYTSVKIKSVSIDYPPTNGNWPWDYDQTIDSLPDIFLAIYSNTITPNDTLYLSDTTVNASSPHTFNTSLTVPITSPDNSYLSLWIDLRDDDPFYSAIMDDLYFELFDYSADGAFGSTNSNLYPSTVTETGGYSKVEFTLELEWIE